MKLFLTCDHPERGFCEEAVTFDEAVKHATDRGLTRDFVVGALQSLEVDEQIDLPSTPELLEVAVCRTE